MEIWIFQTGEPLQSDLNASRSMRAINLSNVLMKRGHTVKIWSSTFDHYTKKQRYNKNKLIKYENNFEVELVTSRGYKSHKSLARLVDHFQLAFNLRMRLRNQTPPDIAFIGFPPIETAWVMTRWLHKKNIPVMIDVKDAWPEIYLRVAPPKFESLIHLITYPFFVLRNHTFNSSDAICAPTKEFLKWSIDKAKRGQNIFDCITPLTSPEILLSNNEIIVAKKSLEAKGLYDTETVRLTFIGSLTDVFDFEPIARAARILPVQFVIAGDGPNFDNLSEELRNYPNILMLGRINSIEASVLIDSSNAMLAPLKDLEDFRMSMPNKFFDAMVNKKAIITSLSGVIEKYIIRNKIGFKYSNDDDSFLVLLQDLIQNVKLLEEYGINARGLYDSEFAFDVVYGNLANNLENLSGILDV